MTAVCWALTAACAVVDWYAVWRGSRATERVAKPLTMVVLIAAAWSMGAPETATGRWVLAGLVLGMVGDVALLGGGERRFLTGLGAFLLGHLAYVAAMLPTGPQTLLAELPGLALVVVLLLSVGRVVLGAVRPEGEAVLTGGVAAYMLVIAAMVVAAWGTALPLVALGATVFMVSDAVLALDRFVRPWRWASLLVMVTYHAGQALIAFGLLR